MSLVMHVLILSLWTTLPNFLRNHSDWLPAWLRAAVLPERALLQAAEPRPLEFVPRPDEYEIPLSFIDVDPALAVAEKPKGAQFQSTANTLAQNLAAPNPELKQPFIGGTQEKFPKLFDVEKPVPQTQPQAKEEPPEIELAEADQVRKEAQALQTGQEAVPVKPAATQPKSELQVALLTQPPGPTTPPLPPSRPKQDEQKAQEEQRPTRRKALKSLAQARQAKGILVGEQMKQDGGVERKGIASVTVERGPFGDYGARMWYAVQERWYATLEKQKYAGEYSGKVTVTFRLHPDGTVTEVNAVDDGEERGIFSLYCTSAIQLSADFGPWSNEMRTTYGPKPIDCQCVFWY